MARPLAFKQADVNRLAKGARAAGIKVVGVRWHPVRGLETYGPEGAQPASGDSWADYK